MIVPHMLTQKYFDFKQLKPQQTGIFPSLSHFLFTANAITNPKSDFTLKETQKFLKQPHTER
jgi:hypothetical protein